MPTHESPLRFSAGTVICRACGKAIPDNLLACPVCLGKAATAEALARQKDYLPGVLTGKHQLRIGTVAGGVEHALLFTSDTRFYCGLELPKQQHKRKAMDWDRFRASMWACKLCIAALEQTLQEALR